MRMIRHRTVAFVVALGMASTMLFVGEAAATGCAEAGHAGGDWPSYGQNLSNTRSQDAETTIEPLSVPTLEAAWRFSPDDEGGTGRIESTPVVAEGCVFITTSSGYVYALNADTGDLVWKDRFSETVQGVCCGGTLHAPAVHDGVLYLNVSLNPEHATDEQGPHVLAVNAHTGDIIWRSESVATEEGAYTNTSAVYFDGLVWIGISNPEGGTHWIGGFAVLDAETGEILKRTRTIPRDQFEAGFGGAAIWSTAAVDVETKTGYAGTGQPSPWDGPESEFANAIVKFDLDRDSDTFGEILGAVKGTWEGAPYIDVDFGASPTLYTDTLGRKMVAAYQKSGWLHAGYRRTMTHAWSEPLSPAGTPLGNYTSTATDGTNIFGVGTFPGQMWSINGSTGDRNWVSPVITTFGANPVAYANGVVYHADGKGFLDAYDSATGIPVLHRPMSLDTGAPCTNIGGGVSIARNTVFSVCGERDVSHGFGPVDADSGWVIAYRLPA